MTITTAYYKQKFPTFQFLNCDIGFDGTLGENEDPLNALKQLKNIAEAFHKQEFPHLYTENGTTLSSETHAQQGLRPVEETVDKIGKKSSREETIASWIVTINSMTTAGGLNNLRPLVEKTPELQEAFEAKLKSLQ